MSASTGGLIGITAFALGWIIGGVGMSNLWEQSAKRGMFEVGHVVYVVKPLRSTAQGAVCALEAEPTK